MTMKNQVQPPDDGRLQALLRESRPAPPLPPRFQESVWRRIERAQAPAETVSLAEWLDRAVAWVFRPRLALAAAAAMLLVGIAIGITQAGSLANERAKRQYIAAVSPLAAP